MMLDIDPGWRVWLINETISAACDEGWHGILSDLLDAFHAVLRHCPGSRIAILQVKEKFAGVRVYWRETNISREVHDQLFDIYRDTQERSYRTCETCGRPGELRKRGTWFSTRCEDHLS